MNLSEPFIRRPVMTILTMSSILFFGIFAYLSLPVSDLPNVDMPTIQVSVNYPGANPETMANAVATPLEQQFMTIQGIQSVLSSSNTGSSQIILTFDLSRNIDAASTDVQQAITAAEPQLPSNLPNNPTYQKVNPAATPILYLAIVNPNMTLGKLYDYANTFIGERLSMIEGIAQVITYGSPYAARIQVDPEKLAAKNIGIDEVSDLLKRQNVDLPLGTLWGQRNDFNIEADGQLLNADGYSEMVIKNQDGSLVKIKDVGRALDSVQKNKYFMHYVDKKADHPCLILAIQRIPGANTVAIVEKINALLDQMKPQLPATLQIFRIYDQSETIIEGVNDVKMTLIVAICLVVLIIYVSLGKAMNTLIPALALPLSLTGTFAIMSLLGFSIDILSLLAMTLSIGFLVDDAIVVLENNVRHVQEGKPPFESAILSAKEISVTIVSMTLCLIAAFIPMIFMGGVIGRLFREFAITIIVAVFISGFVALSLTPMLASKFVKPYEKGAKKPKMEALSEKVSEAMKNFYEPCLHFAMRHQGWVLFGGTLSIVISFFLFLAIPKDFLPPDDVGFIQGYTLARDGTSPYLMLDYHQEISKIAIEDENVESLISISSYNNPNQGVIFFRLKPFHERLPMYGAIQELSQKFQDLPGVKAFLSPLPLINLSVGTTAQALYQYSLTSINRQSLYAYAPLLLQKMQKSPQLTQVSSDLHDKQPQWNFQINRDKASNYNITASQIENFFQYAYSNNKISQINTDINTYDVLIETLPRFYRDPSALSALYIRSQTNALVPLSEIVDVKETTGPLTMNHYNGLPSVGISFNPADGVPLGDALVAIQELTQDMPPEVYPQVIGTASVFKESFESMSFLLLISFFIIYVVLGILYENFIHPLTVMSALPPALFGGLLTLYALGQTLSIYSFVGLILLIGIVLKNGIMMVDFAVEAMEKEGKAPLDAIVQAALTRFRPIIMTTVSTIMGAVPIALGIGGGMAETRKSLGLCIIGGLLISQVLTLLLTPVLFYCFERFRRLLRSNTKPNK